MTDAWDVLKFWLVAVRTLIGLPNFIRDPVSPEGGAAYASGSNL